MPHLRNEALSTAFWYDRIAKGMEELTRIGIKNSETLPSLAKKYFNTLRVENDEPIYTYYDEYMRWFVGQSIKGGNCVSLIQY